MMIPEELKYTKDHEWVKIEGDIATIGVTDFAQSELGDIVYVEADEAEYNNEDVFGSIEAVKTVSDLFAPLSGELIEINELLDASPETVNVDPYGDGWIAKFRIADDTEILSLLSADQYKKEI